MALIVNEAFWLFFFMIGFVGTVDCLVDFAPAVLKRWWRPKFAASLVVAAELLVVLMLTWVLRYFNTTSALTGSVIRNAALLYTATRLSDRKVHAVMLVPTWFLFWPRAGWQPEGMLAFAGILVAMQVVNQYHEWLLAKLWRYALMIVVMTAILWTYTGFVYGYSPSECVAISCVFMVIFAVGDGYDRLLSYRRRHTRQLTYGNNHDELTGVRSLSLFRHDYAYFQNMMKEEQESHLHLVMVDIDHFKAINDQYGHLIGDEALINFARDFEAYFIPMDYYAAVYRTGGEEFSALIYGLTDAQARRAIDDYRVRLSQLQVMREEPTRRLTVSIGISRIKDADEVLKDFIDRTDIKLYAAKRGGRDRVVQSETGD